MLRPLRALLVGLLVFSASGVVSLVVNEPCATYERPGQEDGACPPTCVTCGCCAQVADTVALPLVLAPDIALAGGVPAVPARLPQSRPGDILHVPKARPA